MRFLLTVGLFFLGVVQAAPLHDVVIRGGTVYDGRGEAPYVADVAIDGDLITGVGALADHRGEIEIDASGLAVAPGFVNMLSWATTSILKDPRALSDVKQGVTLEIFGEGTSLGPVSPARRKAKTTRQTPWTTLGEALEHLERRGVGVNIASFVGATTLRIHEIGYEAREPSPAELERMRALAGEAMQQGALGLASALIYSPGIYASTDELTALAKAVGEYDGMYISHLRSEADGLLEALDELLHIAREAEVPAEIYHLKAAGAQNWKKLEGLIRRVEAARAEGLQITADMYTYTAALSGLDAAMPPWVRAGGYSRWRTRLRRPEVRDRVTREMTSPATAWENLYAAAGGAENVLLVGFNNRRLKSLTGQTLAEVAARRGTSPEDTAMDLVIEDGSRVRSIYPLMSEENLRRKIALPWVSFCSDAEAPAPEGAFLASSTHPRAYGSFARLLGRYVRDEQLISLQEAIRRLTSLPAQNLKLRGRGVLAQGYHADVVVFDPEAIRDNATYEVPHQLASGVIHVLVNGTQVLRDGEHTGALPGQVVRGPGWVGWGVSTGNRQAQ
ncbi:MAG: D-aminoacylase [Gammaproteobacteria bacterium]